MIRVYRLQNLAQKIAKGISFVLLYMHCSLSVRVCLFTDSLDELSGDGQYNVMLKFSHTGITRLGFKSNFAPWASYLTSCLSEKW